MQQMKLWMRVCIILVVALAAAGASIGTTMRARAMIEPTGEVTEKCQVFFLDGPNQGTTEPVSFEIFSNVTLIAQSSEYVGGASQTGSWSYTDSTQTTINYTFTASLVAIAGATLTVHATTAVSTTTVTGPASSTITESDGTILPTVHANTTCPAFQPPPSSLCGCVASVLPSVSLSSWVRGAV